MSHIDSLTLASLQNSHRSDEETMRLAQTFSHLTFFNKLMDSFDESVPKAQIVHGVK
jgi:hypothetical protein